MHISAVYIFCHLLYCGNFVIFNDFDYIGLCYLWFVLPAAPLGHRLYGGGCDGPCVVVNHLCSVEVIADWVHLEPVSGAPGTCEPVEIKFHLV